MKSLSVRFASCIAIGMLLVGVSGVGAAETRDGVLIHVTHGTDDPHRVVMALNMASMMSGDHPVLVYFDIKGIEVVLKDAKDITYPHFLSSKEQLSALVKRGVTLTACPGCLKAAGKTPEDLAAGIQVADKDKFFSFTAGRIIVLDY
jgi:predicted peroxiredoxin